MNKCKLYSAMRYLLPALLLAAMMADNVLAAQQADQQPVNATRFRVVKDGRDVAGVMSVLGLDSSVAILEWRNGDARVPYLLKIPGVARTSNIVIRMQTTGAGVADMWNWYKQARNGTIDKRDIVITLMNQRNEPVVNYKLYKSWPCAWHGPELDAETNATAYEDYELAIEDIERDIPSQ